MVARILTEEAHAEDLRGGDLNLAVVDLRTETQSKSRKRLDPTAFVIDPRPKSSRLNPKAHKKMPS